jgi:protein-tyrosine phosphatase
MAWFLTVVAGLRNRASRARKYVRGLLDRNTNNPPLPASCERLLFVCLGNICRSPFAAHIAQLSSDRRALNLQCSSAGFSPSRDGRSPDDAVTVAQRFEVILDNHVPVRLTNQLIDSADCVIAMEASQLRQLRRQWPNWSEKFFLLPLFEPDAAERRDLYASSNISDPFAKGEAAFEAAYEHITASVEGLLSAIAKHRMARNTR